MTDKTEFVPGFTKKSKGSKRSSRWKSRIGNPENSTFPDRKDSAGHQPLRGIVKSEVTHGWVPQGEYVEVAGRIVPGMVYICNSELNPASDDEFADSTFCIDVSKPVHGQEHKGLEVGIDYRFGINSKLPLQLIKYGELTPQDRETYLDWLASGKKDKDCDKNYPMMYFAGLEYRVLKDDCTEQERVQILKEVKRLESLYGKVENIEHYFPRFFDMIDIFFASSAQDVKFPNLFTRLPVDLQVEISDRIQDGKNLSGELLFDWFSFDYGYDLFNSYPLRNLKDRFLEKFAESYPNGLKLNSPDLHFSIAYNSIGMDYFEKRQILFNGRPVLNIAFMEEPLHKAQAILDEITMAMFKAEVNNGNRKPLNLSLLEFASTNDGYFNGQAPVHFPELLSWARRIARERIQTTIGELISKLNEGSDEPYAKPHIAQIADALALIGIGMAPHEILLHSPYLNPEFPVFLYESTNNHRLDLENYMVFHYTIVKMLAGAYLYHEYGLNREKMREKLMECYSKATALKKMERVAVLANLEYIMLLTFDRNYMRTILNSHSWDFIDMFSEELLLISTEFSLDRPNEISKFQDIITRLGKPDK